MSLDEDGEKAKIGHSSQGNLGVGTNQIRFFCNGKSLGALDAVGKTRTGGEAFDNVTSGTYYPAISTYMGGSARINFGPYFIYTPKQSQLPSGRDYNINNLRPVSDLCPPPPTQDEAVEMALKGRNFGKKTDETLIEKFKEAVRTESGLRREAWEKFWNRHLEFVRTEREIRGINSEDLPTVNAPDAGSKDAGDVATVAPLSSIDGAASL
jgi:Set1/Ash2 histone methyltransferase complex subunit ASH2